MFKSLFRRRKPPEDELVPFESLRAIYQRRFLGTDPERFRYLWCAIARIGERAPTDLHENDLLSDLCPMTSKWSNVNPRMDDIEDLARRESSGRDVPEDLTTVGAMMDWLLPTSRRGKRGGRS